MSTQAASLVARSSKGEASDGTNRNNPQAFRKTPVHCRFVACDAPARAATFAVARLQYTRDPESERASDERGCRSPRSAGHPEPSSCTAPKGSQAMRKAGRLTAEGLDMLVPMVRPGRHDRCHRPGDLRICHGSRGFSCNALLSRLPALLLHLDQSRRLPRHSRGEAAAGRRHRQHRCIRPDRGRPGTAIQAGRHPWARCRAAALRLVEVTR